MATLASGCDTHPIIDNMPGYNTNTDTTELPTILGSQRNNPYTLSRMRTAYDNLGYAGLAVNATNLYVRFLPNSASQLSALDSIMDSQNLELFDAPMDYDVLQEGDYYQDPSIPDTSVTWQYAVVPTNFLAPAGITYEVLSQIHIPGDDYTAMETEAERLASIQDSIDCSEGGAGPLAKIIQPNFPQCPLDYHWDVTAQECVCNCCPEGYQWSGNKCVPKPPPPPPSPATDAQVPAGNITVSDNNLATTPTPPVRNLRVVAKRWFKIERTYTDNNGHFQFTKRFKHSVKINVKFKNDFAAIKVFRLTSFWRMLYPVTANIGVFGGNKSNINHNFDKINTTVAAMGNLFWAGATVHNSVQEYREFAAQENFGLPPTGLKIFITRWAHGSGMTPMWNKRWFSGLPQEVAFTFFVGQLYLPAAGVTAFLTVLKHELDMGISYRGATDDYTNFFSDDLKTTTYHELTHSAHYAALGNNWYSQFVTAEIDEIINNFTSGNSPYGDGSNQSNSPIIALGESWAYHMGQFLADRQYGNQSSCAGEQGTCYSNGSITGLNSHRIALEIFNPTFTSDPFYWIPKGLYYDLLDVRNETIATGGPIDDNVSGYTNQQFFNAFNSSITSLEAYRQNLPNINNQAVEVINLFQQYGY